MFINVVEGRNHHHSKPKCDHSQLVKCNNWSGDYSRTFNCKYPNGVPCSGCALPQITSFGKGCTCSYNGDCVISGINHNNCICNTCKTFSGLWKCQLQDTYPETYVATFEFQCYDTYGHKCDACVTPKIVSRQLPCTVDVYGLCEVEGFPFEPCEVDSSL